MDAVVLWLGGNLNRGYHATEVAASIPDSILLISSEATEELCLGVTDAAGFPRSRVLWDGHAWDTVTNFTLTARRIRALRPARLVVVTDGFHMRRSMAIARIVLFGSGIKVIASPSSAADRREPAQLIRHDVLRSLLWRLTGIQHIWTHVYQQRLGRTAPGTFVRMG